MREGPGKQAGATRMCAMTGPGLAPLAAQQRSALDGSG